MKPIPVTEKFSVVGQIQPSDFAELRRLGFKTVINNRPDGEDTTQPGSDAEEAAAKAAGLDYVFIPVTSTCMPENDVRRFAETIVASDGPVIAHCRSGARSFYMWILAGDAEVDGFSDDKLIAVASDVGIAPDASRAWLASHRRISKPDVKGFYDPKTGSIQYVVSDPATNACAIIDPVLDYDEKSGATKTEHAGDSRLCRRAWPYSRMDPRHPSACRSLLGGPLPKGKDRSIERSAPVSSMCKRCGRRSTTGRTLRMTAVSGTACSRKGDFQARHDRRESDVFARTHARLDHLCHRRLRVRPRHAVHAGFRHGAGRFPGGSAKRLWRSIMDILSLRDETRIFTGHDYQPGGRKALWESTVAVQKHSNPHIAGQTEESFIALREARDATLPMPKLILHALQVNMNGEDFQSRKAMAEGISRFHSMRLRGGLVMEAYYSPLAGGALIGLSASLLMLLNGRIAGISGIVAGILGKRNGRFLHDAAFVAGLLLAPMIYFAIYGATPQVQISAGWPLLLVAGLLVGFGTRMGSGCTSGHGISGLARLSPRSFAAVATFLVAGVLTVLAMRAGGWL